MLEMIRPITVACLVTLVLQYGNSQTRDCSLPADLFFVIDGSESVSDADFVATKQFIVEVLKDFDVSQGNIHVGANVFGKDVYDYFNLYGPSKGLYILFEKRIEILSRFKEAGTRTDKALAHMREQFNNEGRDVTRVGVVITDGRSLNMQKTAEQAELARAENINMIAVGVGNGQVFRPELENIATSNDTLFMTQNITQLIDTIKESIKSFTCITPTTVATTARPTAPPNGGLGEDFDCPDCMIDDGHGFWKHPHSCEKYIEIIADANGNRTYLTRKCRDGLFWDQYRTTCRRPEDVECDIDPCATLPIISYDVEDLCGTYIICINKRSRRACCGVNKRYVAGSGCVDDPTCADSCDGTGDNRVAHPTECNRSPHPTKPNYYIESPGEGHDPITRQCAPGTLYSINTCLCDLHDDTPGSSNLGGDCNPSAYFTFDSGAKDISGEHAYAGTEMVNFVGGNAVFSGNGMVNIYRFSMDDFAEGLVIRLKATPSSAGQDDQALLTNCVFSQDQRSSVSIRLIRSSGQNIAVFSTDTVTNSASVSVPFTPFSSGAWGKNMTTAHHLSSCPYCTNRKILPNAENDIVYIYDGENLTGIINGVKRQTALDGRILMRRSGIILGAGSNLNSYTGSIDELYKCFPDFADDQRGP